MNLSQPLEYKSWFLKYCVDSGRNLTKLLNVPHGHISSFVSVKSHEFCEKEKNNNLATEIIYNI